MLLARKARTTVGRKGVSEEIPRKRAGLPLSRTMPTAYLELGKRRPAADEADQAGTQDDDGERHVKEEDAYERRRGKPAHHVVLERALADPDHRLEDDGKHRRLQAKKQRRDDPYFAEGGVDHAEGHDRHDAGHNKQPAGHDAAKGPVHQPTHVGGELLRLRAR
jgi:hypothetical protein